MMDDMDFEAGFGNVLGMGRRGRRLRSDRPPRSPSVSYCAFGPRPAAVTAPNADYVRCGLLSDARDRR